MRELGLKAGAARPFYVYVFGFLIPAVLSELIVQARRGQWDEDDDGMVLDDLLVLFFRAQQRQATALFPFVGPVLDAGIGAWDNRWWNDRNWIST